MTDGLPPFATLADYAAGRDGLLARIVRALTDDSRVAAAWLSGSFGRAEADEWADFDLHVAVNDDDYSTFLDERPRLYARAGRPILVQQEMTSDSMPGGRFQLVIFAGAIEVDWNIGPLSRAVRPLAFKMLIERVAVPVVAPPPLTPEQRCDDASRSLTFFWAMATIAIKYAGRAETRRAVTQIELLSRAFIVLSRLVAEPDGPDPRMHEANRILEPEIDQRLARVGSVVDPPSALDVIRGLCGEVKLLHPALAELGAVVSDDMPAETERLWALAARVAAQGEYRRRTYR